MLKHNFQEFRRRLLANLPSDERLQNHKERFCCSPPGNFHQPRYNRHKTYKKKNPVRDEIIKIINTADDKELDFYLKCLKTISENIKLIK